MKVAVIFILFCFGIYGLEMWIEAKADAQAAANSQPVERITGDDVAYWQSLVFASLLNRLSVHEGHYIVQSDFAAGSFTAFPIGTPYRIDCDTVAGISLSFADGANEETIQLVTYQERPLKLKSTSPLFRKLNARLCQSVIKQMNALKE